MKKSQPERKPLRQRVADRKRGIKEVVPLSERMEKFYKYLNLFFTTCQYLGLVMLLFSLGTIVTNEFMIDSWDLIVVYCAMFIIGRAGLTIMSTILKFK
jgi:hypothetical protein